MTQQGEGLVRKSWWPKVAILVAGIMLAACATFGAPDGFTREGWNAYRAKFPQEAKAVEYIQASPKRRQQRDIYLRAMSKIYPFGYAGESTNGHVSSQMVEKNKMTGENFFHCYVPAHELYHSIYFCLSRGDGGTFTEALAGSLKRFSSCFESANTCEIDSLPEKYRADAKNAKINFAILNEASRQVREIGE